MTCLSEYHEQVAFISWFKVRFPTVLIWANEAGGPKTLLQGIRLKKQGVMAGVPDLFIPLWKTFIEMKRTKGGARISPAQQKMANELKSYGYSVHFCFGAQEAIKVCEQTYKEYDHDLKNQ